MSDSIIKVEDLSKSYVIGHDMHADGEYRYGSLRDTMAHWGRSLYQRLRHPLSQNRENVALEKFWALKDMNFEIKKGDRIGIIGRNGAGKTTLLKILSRITEPTKGKITLNGRVASLLEVGTGFHPELSGRENIYLNGAVLGMTRAEIKKKFDEIVAFAGVEKFLDTPVKRYSSGMYVRLAFAVAAHLEPEILLVDEVLAVGDMNFRKKCMKKMKDVSATEGRTVLFVSHDMSSIQQICNKTFLIKNGRLAYSGTTGETISRYLHDNEVANRTASNKLEWCPAKGTNLPYEDIVKIKRFYIADENGNIVNGQRLLNSKHYNAVIEADLVQSDSRLIFSVACYDENQHLLFTTDVHDSGGIDFGEISPGPLTLSVPVPVDLFWNRKYTFELICAFHYVAWVLPPDNPSRLHFEVFCDQVLNPYANEHKLGVLAPILPWKVSEL